MAHLIETNATTGMAEIAYVGQKPWHGLGQELNPDADIDTWSKMAGLDWEAKVSPVRFQTFNEVQDTLRVHGQNVVYRSDTFAPLGLVTDRYKLHQPKDVLDFFNVLMQSAGFKLEVAGAIKGGKRIWALANTNKEACVLGDDAVRGYLLLSTSFDGSTATVGQFTSVRVVCNNTLSAADNEVAPSRFNITHGREFDASLMRDKLGLVVSGFDGMMDKYRHLARQQVGVTFVKDFLTNLFPANFDPKTAEFKPSRGYNKVLELFEGKGMGADLQGAGGTRWGLLNAVTQYIDHDKGHNVDSRMNNAWFGNGNRMKSEAESLLLA
jgi:phage/plasmid-like protein (TIGR03299 family)